MERYKWLGSEAAPINPNELAEQSSSEYSDLDEAISVFIESEWPRGIDGIPLSRRGKP